MILNGGRSARKDMVYGIGLNKGGTKIVNAGVRRGRYKLIWQNANINKFKKGKEPYSEGKAYLYDLRGKLLKAQCDREREYFCF